MTDTKYFEDVDTAIKGLNDRHPLVFDDESLHGNAALLAAAALIVDWRDNAVTARDRQVRDLEHLIATLQQYRDLTAAGVTATWPDYQYETEADRLRDKEAVRAYHEAGVTFAVITIDPASGAVTDCEFLSGMPRWDWLALGQVVRVGNVNGGDSALVDMPESNKGR